MGEQFTREGYSEHNKHSDRQYRQSLRDTSFSGFIRPFSQFLPYLNCLGFALHARKAEAQIFGRLQGCLERVYLACARLNRRLKKLSRFRPLIL